MRAQAVVYGLLDWSVRSMVLAGGVAVALWVLRVKNPYARLTTWTVLVAAILLMPLARVALPSLDLPIGPAMTAEEPAALVGPRAAAMMTVTADAVEPAWPTFAVSIWAGVAAIFLARLVVGLWLTHRLVRSSRAVEDGIRESDHVTLPATVGLLRPVILLPSDWRDWPESTRLAVLAHERAHVQRRDCLRLLGASFYRCVAWFHPLAWWLRSHLLEAAEHASDDAAAAEINDRIQYAETLLGFMRRNPPAILWHGMAMATRKERSARMNRILDLDRHLARPIPATAVYVLTAMLAPVVYVAATARVAPAEPVRPRIALQTNIDAAMCGGGAAYRKWLTEDVTYVIFDEEAQAMNRLRTEAECQQFIEQFWKRRDRTPGTPGNEAKEEHYRRIAYSNERFAERVAGWRTDRGRFYITFGPPDEIEWHPNPRAGAVPYQVWLYKQIQGIGNRVLFRFEDQGRNGEYRMVKQGTSQ
jgi:GWxTD domain-containing protein